MRKHLSGLNSEDFNFGLFRYRLCGLNSENILNQFKIEVNRENVGAK